MDAPSVPPLALRIGDQDHALEPGRTYLLGNGPGCDLRLAHAGVTEHHLRLELRHGQPVLACLAGATVNGMACEQAVLRIGDTIRAGEAEVRIVRDLGSAAIVPDPLLRTAAEQRRPIADAVDGPPPLPDEPVPLDPVVAASMFPPPPPTALRRRARRSATAMPLRRQHEATFTDLMADELRRAPWLSLSALLHGIVVLLLWWWFLEPVRDGRDAVRIGFLGELGPEATSTPHQGLESQVVTEQPDPNVVPLPEAEPLPEPSAAATDEGAPDFDPGLLLAGNERVGSSAGGSGGGSTLDKLTGGGGGDRGGFRKTVSELRKTGLEIVFVFDSTGSMNSTIEATKQQIADMLEALRALVPDARFGLVTFRDRQEHDNSYLVRSVPLGQDFWRACNFMQFIDAGGGGDRPEAVDVGLRTAFEQQWRPGARRVVVLAGDAPVHSEHENELLQAVARFASTGSSFVHAMVSSPRDVDGDTKDAFARIAKKGKGVCLDSRDFERLMQQVLSLAFGREHEQTLGQVLQIVRDRNARIETWALDTARVGGEGLFSALRRDPVPEELVRALLVKPRRGTTAQLAQWLGTNGCPAHTRQAIAYVLQRALAMREPPIGLDGSPPDARQILALQMLANRLPN
ncbi:MAG: VWA domain-containing protein [Planctomycetes bacterium]|nr:VWA domain-containing protein [Planctomycetota bacterium]